MRITVFINLALLFLQITTISNAQERVTLESCRTLALENNKLLRIAELEELASQHEHNVAQSAYLPKIYASGIYLHRNHKTSLLGNKEKRMLENIGATLQEELKTISTLFPEIAKLQELNALGGSIADALVLDTRNIFAATITVEQPIFTGGKIVAYNKLAKLMENIARYNYEAARQDVILSTDRAYWLVVSLSNKERLAASYVDLTKKLSDNVEKMFKEGIATKAELLNVKVRLNEAHMAHLRAKDGTRVARMQLCHICGLPLDHNLLPADEILGINQEQYLVTQGTIDNRPELQSLILASRIAQQQTNITRADYLPQLMLIGGYTINNPSITDGFRRRFDGTWNIGLMLKIPLWNWGEGYNKIKASKARANIATYNLDDTREKMKLQIQQCINSINEAQERLSLATSNIVMAEENLRNITLSFNEGVATSEEVMQAQTALIKASSELIDAEIEIRVAQTEFKRATGNLNIESR